jgi:hypothetical protein
VLGLGHAGQVYEDPTEVGVGEHNYLLDYAPHFLDGYGPQVTVSTAHRGEVQNVLREAMERIGLEPDDYSTPTILQHLLLVSGLRCGCWPTPPSPPRRSASPH